MSDAAAAVRPTPAPSPTIDVEPEAPKPGLGSPGGRAHFIPVSRYGLRAKLVEMLKEDGGGERQWQRALDCLAAWRHQQYRMRRLDLLEDYLPFSPDSDTASLVEYDEAGKGKARREFIDGVETLLIQANYVRLEADDLRRILAERSPHGLSLQVDLSEFDDLVLYYRGVEVAIEQERDPRKLYLKTNCFEVPTFQRLFLMLKLKPADVRVAEIMATKQLDRNKAERVVRSRRRQLPIGVSASHIYVKVFKRIPQVDLEMLFPNTKIAFKPMDKLKLLVTCGGGTAAGVMGTATKILAATNPFTLTFGLLGFSAGVFRQVMNFFNTRNRYMMVLAQNLYFCSLANNRGALTLIADAAEEEDVKEDSMPFSRKGAQKAKIDLVSVARGQGDLDPIAIAGGFEPAGKRPCARITLQHLVLGPPGMSVIRSPSLSACGYSLGDRSPALALHISRITGDLVQGPRKAAGIAAKRAGPSSDDFLNTIAIRCRGHELSLSGAESR